MKGFVDDIEKLTEENTDFRRVLYTGKHLQLVLMALQPGEDIGEEVHAGHDQFFRFEKGNGEVVIDGVSHKIKSDFGVIVPAGAIAPDAGVGQLVALPARGLAFELEYNLYLFGETLPSVAARVFLELLADLPVISHPGPLRQRLKTR